MRATDEGGAGGGGRGCPEPPRFLLAPFGGFFAGGGSTLVGGQHITPFPNWYIRFGRSGDKRGSVEWV